MRTFRHVTAAVLLSMPALRPAAAQPAFDPARLPATTGRVAQYSLTPRGDVDGLILEDGTEILLPPHLGPRLVQLLRPGDTAVAHGLRARVVAMVLAASVANPATGQTVADDGSPPPGPPAAPAMVREPVPGMTASGTVRSQLHGPKGDLNGVLLADGTVVRLPPGEASRLADRLRPGLTVAVQGAGMRGPLGQVVAAARIGPDADHLEPLQGGPGPAPR